MNKNRELCELLGICWHEIHGETEDDGVYRSFCVKCDKDRSCGPLEHRTFRTPADALDVMNRLVEMGKWEEFSEFARDQCFRSPEISNAFHSGHEISWSTVVHWLFSPDPTGVYRICELAGEFIKERG